MNPTPGHEIPDPAGVPPPLLTAPGPTKMNADVVTVNNLWPPVHAVSKVSTTGAGSPLSAHAGTVSPGTHYGHGSEYTNVGESPRVTLYRAPGMLGVTATVMVASTVRPLIVTVSSVAAVEHS